MRTCHESSPSHQRTHGWEHGEFYGVLLLSASGMAMMAISLVLFK